VLRVDQRRRWQAGERVPAEDYLRRHPALAADPDAALDLIFHEFLLREERGERPAADEFLHRFPGHADGLRAQIELHRALETRGAPGPPPPLNDRTTAYAAAPAAAERPLKVALVPDGGAQGLTGEIQALLRKRLLVISCIFAATAAVEAVVTFVSKIVIEGFSLLGALWWDAALLAVWAVLVAVLGGKRPLSLRQLRALELIGFSALGLMFGWWTYQVFRSDALLRYASLRPDGVVVLAGFTASTWFALILMYGLFIPNTWRRCAAVVGCMGLAPFAIGAAAGFGPDTLDGQSRTNFLIVFGFSLAFGAVLAVFGSHRISTLQREAFEARRFGQYRLKERLGGGGMGEVFLAEHVLLRRPCALKVMRPDRAAAADAAHRFEREVRATAALTSWHTVEIYDYGRAADGTFYYVMEYLPGRNLDELVRADGPLEPARAVRLLRQVCEALREAHAAGLTHRDIKPGNIIVCARGGHPEVAKLLDFGLVQARGPAAGDGRLTGEGAVVGTPAFMSPEQAAGRADVDARSDLYSLGVVAYFLLTGRPPFACPTAIQTLAAHLGEAPAPLRNHRPDVPADLEAVVLRCLEKDPARRYATATELDEALARCGPAFPPLPSGESGRG
jgi:serine/threonine-protein kinase